MAITKPPVLPPWADAGDKVQPSNAEIQVGWPLSSIPPSRQRFNWLLNFLANGVRYFSRRGLPDYDAAETYMTGDRVIGDDGKTYRSLIDNNTAQTPSASPTKWEEWAPTLARFADLIQKQTYVAFTTAGAAPNFTLTPSPAITAYAAGQRFRVKFHAAGSGADVLNVNALGNKSIKQYDTAGAKVAAVIAANQLADVEYDGVDFVLLDRLPTTTGPTPAQFDNTTKLATTEFIQRALGSLRFQNFYTVSTVLDAANIGALNEFSSGAAITCTIPASNSVPKGSGIWVMNNGTGNLTVNRSGADILENGATTLTSLTLKNGDSVFLASNGGTKWLILGGSGQLPVSPHFASSIAGNGYRKLPSGDIEQWGSVVVSASANTAVTLPIAFPSAIYGVTITPVLSSGTGGVGVNTLGLSGFNIWNGFAGALTVYWRAIGK